MVSRGRAMGMGLFSGLVSVRVMVETSVRGDTKGRVRAEAELGLGLGLGPALFTGLQRAINSAMARVTVKVGGQQWLLSNTICWLRSQS